MDVINLTKALISYRSVTPQDEGCQALLIKQLEQAGFNIKLLASNGVNNFYAWHGEASPVFIFAGHTDVVPAGPLDSWNTDPFVATEDKGMLYGRGAADMKSAVAAMIVSAINFVKSNPNHAGTIALAITGDEEGVATDGSVKIVEYLQQQNIKPDYVLIGEPSSDKELGDIIKTGRRGSLHGHLTIFGKQGHIAYPDKSDNAIHRSLKALDALVQTQWDQGNDDFPATTLQFCDIQAGVGATNVVPGRLEAKFNCRFSPVHSAESLQKSINAVLDKQKVRYHIDYQTSSLPFFSGECDLSRFCQQAIAEICQRKAESATTGGTSDGRFFAPICSQVVELGVVNETIHKNNECVSIEDMQKLTEIYGAVLVQAFR